MAQEDDSFNAKGPTVVAFETLNNDPSNQAFGVSVTGKQCGVFGESYTLDPAHQWGTRPGVSEVPTGTGVCGHGDGVGVQGSSRGLGVSGNGGRIGVFASGGITGVNARIEHNNSMRLDPEEAAIIAEAADPSKTNISGVGIRAWSELNRAGVFANGRKRRAPELQSGRIVAQVHLVPIEAATPPAEGQAGDIIAISVPGKEQFAQLWFCRLSSGPGQQASWIQLA